MNPLNTRLLSRRTMLKAGGVAVALPLLDAMLPSGRGAEQAARQMNPHRMVLISRPLGVHAPYLFPEKAGRDYEPTRYLKLLEKHRQDFTVFSGMSHLDYPNAHHTEAAIFTGVSGEFMQRESDIRNTVSLDIVAAEQIGKETRYPNIVLGNAHSYNRKGIRIPSVHNESHLFRQLFVDGTPDEIAKEVRRLEDGRSILDGVREQAKDLARNLGPADRDRLDSLLTSIREAEARLQQDIAWVARPKPQVNYDVKEMREGELVERQRQWFDLIHLAVQTDSTRIIALHVHSHIRPNIEGVSIEHHEASHHGQDETKVKQLATIEEAEFQQLNYLLEKLKSSSEQGATLLDRTMVLHVSNLGNASSHTPHNLPVILAGGGFRHSGHVAYSREKNRPLSDLYLRMLHQMGVEAKSFGSSQGVVGDLG